jgi:predicted Zn-dependent protease with MMP-like domain
MDLDNFEVAVDQALSRIPRELRDQIDNVGIIIQDFADRETLESLGIESPYALLGLYSGVPTSERSFFMPAAPPDRIFLYRKPILRSIGPQRPAQQVIYDVLLHEIGHHFGFDEERLRSLEEGES